MKKKAIALIAACLLLAIGIGAGSLAWLTATTVPVTNTFTTSDIKIELNETTGSTYKMVPGYTISKDPKVTVKKGSEECWLFVKLEKSANFDTYLTYEMADGWTKLTKEETDLIYYRQVLSTATKNPLSEDAVFSVLKDNQVTVKDTVTKDLMNALEATQTTAATYPTLKVTAYASQLHKNASDNFTAFEVWNNISK